MTQLRRLQARWYSLVSLLGKESQIKNTPSHKCICYKPVKGPGCGHGHGQSLFSSLHWISLTQFPHWRRVGLVESLLEAEDHVLQGLDVSLQVQSVLGVLPAVLQGEPHHELGVTSLQQRARGESCLESPVHVLEVKAGQSEGLLEERAVLGWHGSKQLVDLGRALRVFEDIIQDLSCLCCPALALNQGSENGYDCSLLSRHPIRLSHITPRGWCQDFFNSTAEIYNIVRGDVFNILNHAGTRLWGHTQCLQWKYFMECWLAVTPVDSLSVSPRQDTGTYFLHHPLV